MKNDNRPIGIFDSGLGGLTVVSALRQSLPHENIIYLGDTARVPYGDKSPENIAKFATQDAEFLVGKGVKAIIIACNTVSAVALSAVEKAFPKIPIIGVLEGGIKACLDTKPSSIVVIGTRATISSDAYRRGIHALSPSINVRSIATPLLVPIVEEGLQNEAIAESATSLYLGQIEKNPPDILLLACTHYPLIRTTLAKQLPQSVLIIDSAEACANFAMTKILELGISAGENQNGGERFFVTDMPFNFYAQAKRFLGRELESFEKISLSC
jgi:glutamate racemase